MQCIHAEQPFSKLQIPLAINVSITHYLLGGRIVGMSAETSRIAARAQVLAHLLPPISKCAAIRCRFEAFGYLGLPSGLTRLAWQVFILLNCYALSTFWSGFRQMTPGSVEFGNLEFSNIRICNWSPSNEESTGHRHQCRVCTLHKTCRRAHLACKTL
jgi:hypothetical protein